MSDEDFTQQISQSYFILYNPNAEPDRINEVSAFLMNFYSQPNSFPFITNYIISNNDSFLQNGAILGLKIIIQLNPAILQDPQAYYSLLNLTIVPSEFVRKNAIFYILNFMELSKIEPVIQFVQSLYNPMTENTINDIQIDTCMKLLRIVIKEIEDDSFAQYIDFCSSLSNKAFQSSNINIAISGAIFRLSFLPLFQDETNPVYEEYLNSTIQLLSHLLLSKADSLQIDELVTALADFIQNNPMSANYQKLIDLAITFLSLPETTDDISEQLLCISDNVIESCQDMIKDQPESFNMIFHLFNSYCFYSKKTYNPENSYESSKLFTFSTFFNVFYEDQFIEQVYQIIPTLFNEDSAGKFTSLLILNTSLEYSSDFYSPRIPEIYNFLSNSMREQDFCVRSTTSFVIKTFCQFLKPSIEFNSIITSLLESISVCPAIEFITALTEIFKISTQTDSYFDQCFTFLFKFLESVEDVILRQATVVCLSSLTSNSRERVCAYFDQVFSVMSHIVLSEDDANSVLVSPSISCLSHLCESCTAQMQGFIPQFLEVISRNLSDVSSQFDCINAVAIICEFYADQSRSFARQLISPLMDIANVEVDYNEFGGDGFQNEDEFEFQDDVNATSAAIRAVCKLMCIYPDMLPEFFEAVYSILMKFRNSEKSLACAKGVWFIAKAVLALPESGQLAGRIINELLLPLLRNSSDEFTSGSALDALSVLVMKNASLVNDSIFEAISMPLNGQLFFQSGKVCYNECLFQGILHLLKSLMKMNCFESLQGFVPLIQRFLQSKSCGLRDFSLKFFGALVSISKNLSVLSNESIPMIIQIALETVDGYASIDCIRKFVETAPKFMNDLLPQILQMINNRFLVHSDEGVSINKNTIVAEKCILLIASLHQFMGVNVSAFSPFIIQATPPTVLIRKTSRFFYLIHWICQNNDRSLCQALAAAIIKLLAESDNLLNKRNLPNDQIMSIKEILRNLAGEMPNFRDFCVEVCENDGFKLANLQNHFFQG